jgi:hypothetical protein
MNTQVEAEMKAQLGKENASRQKIKRASGAGKSFTVSTSP